MATEFELKYEANPSLLERIGGAFDGLSQPMNMTTTYYDDPQGMLSERRWTLRHRQEGESHICTLKTPGTNGGRGEWETECEDIFQALPRLEAMTGLTLPGTIRPICGARFTRRTAMVCGAGFVAELALDQGVLTGGEREEPLCEVELELKEGSQQALEAYGVEFQARFGLKVQPKSKFARARALCRRSGADLWSKYDRLLLFDTETTGLDCRRDEIIEFAAVVVERTADGVAVTGEYDELVSLSPGGFVPPKIQQLTGISARDLQERGISKTRLCADIAKMLTPKTLLIAYNAHFDLSFLYYLLLRSGDPAILKGKDKLDLLTVYRDRHSYPHRLANAIEVYGLSDQVVNSHRAVDDVLATVAVMQRMQEEKEDLMRYINLFGYNPKYGLEGKPIGSVTYKPQPYNPKYPLYEG